MTLSDILRGAGAREIRADAGIGIKDVVNDSELVTPGALFAACSGEHGDGADHIGRAVSLGCAAVICRKKPDVAVPYVISDDPRRTYAFACANFYGNPQEKLIMTAVTGTNGKSTVTSMLWHILRHIHGADAVCLIGGVSNIVRGIPKRADQTTPDPGKLYRILSEAAGGGASYAVTEASSHALDYEKLSPCRIRLGVMTNLTEDHLDHHKTIENYFESKKKLIPLCRDFISNGDDPFTKTLRCPHFSLYSGEYTAKISELTDRSVSFSYRGRGSAECTVPVLGKFNVYNALAALACAEILGEDARTAADGLSDFHGVPGRFRPYPLKNGAVAVIDYAHTPDALENALHEARRICKNRLICVFGCGGDRETGKRRLMGGIASRMADLCVITSDNSRSEDPGDIIAQILKGVDKSRPYTVIENRTEALKAALGCCKEDDVVLLAGKGHEDYEEDKNGKRPFSEESLIKEFNDGGNDDGDNDSGGGGGSL